MLHVPDESITNETRLTRIQALVVEILNDLLRSSIENADVAIDRAIARLGSYCKRDRSYVFFKHEEFARNTHEWCAEGIEPAKEHLQFLPWEGYGPELIAMFERNQPLHVPYVPDLEENPALRDLFTMQSIVSVILVPMLHNGELCGFIGFDSVHVAHAFLPGEIYLLQSVADVICTVYKRRESERARQNVQDELNRERAFLSSILATRAVGITVIEPSGVVTYTNDLAKELLGNPGETLVGMPTLELAKRLVTMDGRKFLATEQEFVEAFARRGSVVEGRFTLGEGENERCLSIHAATLSEQEGKIEQVVCMLLDVSDHVRSEKTREEALEEARRANAAKTNFLAKMSHEMRTPLNGVLGIAEVLEGLVHSPEQQRMIKAMHDSGTLLLGIINDLLDMSKIEAEVMEIEVVPFDLEDLALRLEDVHTLKASEKRLSFGVALLGDASKPRAGDPYRLLQILHNLISNAIKFTDGGEVQVVIDCRSPDSLGLSVRDTGIGISADQIAAVFEDFGQADSSIARRFGGTGLGMPIVRRLVDMMGGKLELRSVPGEGTLVEVDLPVAVCEGAEPSEHAPMIVQKERDLRGVRILAADDNRTNRMILSAMLSQLGVNAEMVVDGMSALSAAAAERYDIVILDISMPGMDGVTVMQEMRRREAMGLCDHVPILAFTANAMSHQVASYLAAGFDDCLTKPLQLDRLRQSLSDALTRYEAVAAG